MKAVLVFYSYAQEDGVWKDELEKHLTLMQRNNLIAGWNKRDIQAGSDWREEVDEHLNAAQIILLLISPDFFASDYCYGVEMTRAMERHANGEARVIPILLRPVAIKDAPFSHLKMLPSNNIPITSTSWPNKDEAFLDVEQGIRTVVERFLARPKDYWLALGQNHNAAGRYELALAAFEHALYLDPRYARAYRSKGDVLYNLEHYQEALESYKIALRLDPNHARIHCNVGDIFRRAGRYEDALAAYEHALRLDPRSAGSYHGKGSVLYSMRCYKEALAAYEKAIKLDPHFPASFHNYGRTLYRLKRYNEALMALNQALALKPDFKQAYLSRADVFERIGRIAESQADRAYVDNIGE
jgi:tetratricopeptide (TPR) repeat protein